MTPAAPVIADLFLSLCAVAGLLILLRLLVSRGGFEPLNRRFLFGVRVMLLLFAGRALGVLTGSVLFRVAELLGAALIPLAVLLLAEGLLRRHAPLWAKLWIAGGTMLFGLLAMWLPLTFDTTYLIALLVFQMSGFVIGGWLVVTRDATTLSAAENQTVERLALSLLLLIPLAAADFLMVFIDIPVQVSPLGVLFLCWLAVSLGRGQGRHRAALASFIAIALGAGASTAVLALMAGMDKHGVILTLAVVLASVLVAVLLIEARTLRAEEQSESLLRHMASSGGADPLEFLRGLQAHPLVEGAAIVTTSQLNDLDSAVLRRIFAAAPVLRRADPPFAEGSEGDHVDHLFRRFDASHILLADDAPMTLVALSMPAIATSARAELELAAVQRMARLMSGGPS